MLPFPSAAAHLELSEDFPNSRVFDEQGLVLPSGPDQPLENIDKVIRSLQSFS